MVPAQKKFTELFSEELRSHGLAFLGVSPLDLPEDYERYRRWIQGGGHGAMDYLARNSECRENPRKALSKAGAVLCFALPYAQGEKWPFEGNSRVASYARFEDYHVLLKRVVQGVMKKCLDEVELSHLDWRVITDSAPVLERAMSAQTRTGFIGKNTCFIHHDLGSFVLLGEVLVEGNWTEEVVAASPVSECGECTLCQVECPTGALSKDYVLDSKKCLSYWTIEHRGTIPYEYWPWLGKYWFGCDICQLVCPHNSGDVFIPPQIPLTKFPSLFEVAVMDERFYEEHFGGTPLTRARIDGLKRNALIAMKVTHDEKLPAAIFANQLSPFPVVRETLSQIKNHSLNTP